MEVYWLLIGLVLIAGFLILSLIYHIVYANILRLKEFHRQYEEECTRHDEYCRRELWNYDELARDRGRDDD